MHANLACEDTTPGLSNPEAKKTAASTDAKLQPTVLQGNKRQYSACGADHLGTLRFSGPLPSPDSPLNLLSIGFAQAPHHPRTWPGTLIKVLPASDHHSVRDLGQPRPRQRQQNNSECRAPSSRHHAPTTMTNTGATPLTPQPPPPPPLTLTTASRCKLTAITWYSMYGQKTHLIDLIDMSTV